MLGGLMARETDPAKEWAFDPQCRHWVNLTTDESFAQIQIDNMQEQDISSLPKTLRLAIYAKQRKDHFNRGGKLYKQRLCEHEDKVEITTFYDAKRIYHCPDCGYSDPSSNPTPKSRDRLADLETWIAQQETFVDIWKKRATKEKEDFANTCREVDKLIEEVFNAS